MIHFVTFFLGFFIGYVFALSNDSLDESTNELNELKKKSDDDSAS